MKRVLVIDDEPGHRLMVRAVMEDAGWQVLEAASGEEGLEVFSSTGNDIPVVLVDMKMSGMDGQETLTRLHELCPSLPVVLLTAYGTVGSAVEAMKSGAFDYLTKPADNDELVLTLNRAWEYRCLLQENDRLRTELSGEDAIKALKGTSAPMRRVHEFVRLAGPSEATVLITGESGTGKELLAEALHAASLRSKKPLIKVNCAALPGQLLESELFGYERGAFTGAVKDKPGRFQLAAGGTLFLDEIGDLPFDLQAKLLRAIQERIVEPLGSVRSVPVDVRILAATNRNLRQGVLQGQFREDLFFRLNVLEVEIPPLRDRLDDLPFLTTSLLQRLSEKNRKNVRGVSPAFLQALANYGWPGNVRELENILERALILSRSDILEADSLPLQIIAAQKGAPHIPPPSGNGGDFGTGSFDPYAQQRPPAAPVQGGQGGQGGAPGFPGGMGLQGGGSSGSGNPAYPAYSGGSMQQGSPIQPGDSEAALKRAIFNTYTRSLDGKVEAASLYEEAELQALLHALTEHGGHREKTAEALGISRRTLQYRLKKYGLSRRG